MRLLRGQTKLFHLGGPSGHLVGRELLGPKLALAEALYLHGAEGGNFFTPLPLLNAPPRNANGSRHARPSSAEMPNQLVNGRRFFFHGGHVSTLSAGAQRAIGIATYTADMGNMGQRIRDARKAFPGRMSQESLAELIGVTRGAVSQWENGLVTDISAINLHKISLCLRQDYIYLLTGKSRAPTEGEMSFDEIELLAMFRAMTEIGRKAAIQQVEQLCKLFRAPAHDYHAREAKLSAANRAKRERQ